MLKSDILHPRYNTELARSFVHSVYRHVATPTMVYSLRIWEALIRSPKI